MATYKVPDLKWGSYKNYEGWYSYGPSFPLVVTASDSSTRKELRVVTSTESPRSNAGAVNAYDVCMISTGDLQLCEIYHLSTDLIGFLVTNGIPLTETFREAMNASGVVFRRNPKGRWRFYRGNGSPVESTSAKREVYFDGCSGLKGGWTDSGKERSALWVAGYQEMLISEGAVPLQRTFLESRIRSYVLPEAKELLWGRGTPDPGASGWAGAVRAAFLSFSVNNSVIAQENLLKAKVPNLFSEEGFLRAVKALTFAPGNPVIYPKRYEDLRPILENLYGIDLPDARKELAAWSVPVPLRLSPKQIQERLIQLGYDIGPAGADGFLGKRSTGAIKEFQTKANLVVDGIPGVATVTALVAATSSL